jgi:hypothetical protein
MQIGIGVQFDFEPDFEDDFEENASVRAMTFIHKFQNVLE